MPKLFIFGAIAAMAAAFAIPAAADPPEQVVTVEDFSMQSGLLTAACGTPVFRSFSGTVRVILRTNADGSVSETDVLEHFTVTLSAPAYGTSFSWTLGPAFYEYPEGAFIGAPAIVTVLGVDSNVPGVHASSGRTVFQGVVTGFTSEGVPIADTFAILSQDGNQIAFPDLVPAICAALTG